MHDLLEDPEGAPYPQEAQMLWKAMKSVISSDDRAEFREYLIEALESVAHHEI